MFIKKFVGIVLLTSASAAGAGAPQVLGPLGDYECGVGCQGYDLPCAVWQALHCPKNPVGVTKTGQFLAIKHS
jgi:hypothetical protein